MSGLSEREILVGIVTFNRIEKLTKTLAECFGHGFHDIVVVDNGSTDGTREFLLTKTEVEAIFAERNEGGAGGFNRIMRYFVDNPRHKWLLLFDDDAYPLFDETSLINYLACESDASVPAYAFKVTYPNGTLCEMNRAGVNILDKNPVKMLLQGRRVQDSTGTCLVDYASFVGLLLRRETIERIGLVSKQFFIYSDDTFYTLSISSRIGKIRYCDDFIFIHDCNRTSRRLINHDSSRLAKDVVNKIVLIREYSKFYILYVALYIGRLIVHNPRQLIAIASASIRGMSADLELYRNESLYR